MENSEKPFLARRSFLGVSNALALLMLVCFLVPFAFRGARLGLRQTENNVKDWLPTDFRETSELNWFSTYFSGERFIVATWPGCTSDDQRLKLMLARLNAECVEKTKSKTETPEYLQARKVGAELKLLAPADFQTNWGQRNEKWLTSENGTRYFITPEGHLYRWSGEMDLVSGVGRAIQRRFNNTPVEGQFVTAFGLAEEGKDSPFYTNPFLVTAPLFQNVQTGPSVAAELDDHLMALEINAPERRLVEAQRLASERLTGSLFAPAVPKGFAWTPTAFAEALGIERAKSLPADWERVAQITIDGIVEEQYEGHLVRLRNATSTQQAEHWYAVFDAIGVPSPPRQTAVLVTLTKLGEENLANAVGRGVLGEPRGRLLQLAEEAGVGVPPPPSLLPPPLNYLVKTPEITGPLLHLGGPPVTNVAIDEEGSITLVRLLGYSILVGILLTYMSLRNVSITMMVLFVSGVSAASCIACVWFGGDRLDAILLSMPPLIYTMAISEAIHLVNYYREEVEERGVVGAIERSAKHAWFPCFLAAFTTAIGTMSLCTSNLRPIRNFGLYSGIGVMISLLIVFAFLPAALYVFARKLRRAKPGESNNAMADAWQHVGEWIIAHHRPVGAICVVLMLLGTFGLTKLETNVQLMGLFSADSQTLKDYAWLEQNFGRLIPMELILRVPSEVQQEHPNAVAGKHPMNLLERAELVQSIQHVVEQAFGESGADVVGHAMATTSFMPRLPPPSNGYDVVRSRFNSRLQENRETMTNSEYLRVEQAGDWKESELWRISLRVAALGKLDYGYFIDSLRVAVEPILQAHRIQGDILDKSQFTPGAKAIRVAILGAPKPKLLRETKVYQKNSGADLAKDVPPGFVDSQAIFQSVLGELLDNTTLKKLWFDPSNGAMQGKATDPEWGKTLAAMDCVVLVADHSDYDVDFIRKHAKQIVDARNAAQTQTIASTEKGVPIAIGAGPLQVIYTGAVPVVYKAQRTLLQSLIDSTWWSFIMIAATMAWLMNPRRGFLRSLHPKNLYLCTVAGLVAMLPNIFPLVIVFGAMGFMGISIDIGVMMTSSVALGIAVDDTIHFLTWYRDALSQGMTQNQATAIAYRRVGPAMTQTALVSGLGMFVFALSTFTPTMRFGVMMLVMLIVAVFGDLIWLPALLASRWGRFFVAQEKDPSQQRALEATLDSAAERSSKTESGQLHEPKNEIPSPHFRHAESRSGAGRDH